MTQDMSTTRELVSALADGQLRGEEFARALALTEHSEDARAQWHAYHLVGDVLRSGELAASSARDAAFAARLRQRLQQEASMERPAIAMNSVAFGTDISRSEGQNRTEHPSANDASLRWKLVAGLASLATVMVVGWHVTSNDGTAVEAPQLAQRDVPAQPVAVEATPAMIRDPRLDQLLAAHQQFGGTSALQMPAGFVRNATFERPAR
ncbi:MAG: anti-anti-sigma factor [Curvibacter sp. PD_MW3]|nr:MAG: anti-anti-sigma factor [Curvibacter sp. PD_MW3]